MTLFLAILLSLNFAGATAPRAASTTTPRIAPPLPALAISSVTVSGVSSGAFMAVQLGVAHSSTIAGVGSVAGGIYWCAEGDAGRSRNVCMAAPEKIDAAKAIGRVRDAAKAGTIDDPAALARQKIYLLQSAKDPVVRAGGADKLVEFYAAFGPAARIREERSLVAGHGFPTVDFGLPCERSGPPWILDCGFDGAAEILKHLVGPLAPAVAAKAPQVFDQTEFGSAAALMSEAGWVYVPDACRAGTCPLHVALHGCQMSPEFIGDKFAVHAGFNRWAEANRIVVLYPAAAKSKDNPVGCWDWFGYTGADYAERSAPQIRALKSMIDRLSGRSLSKKAN